MSNATISVYNEKRFNYEMKEKVENAQEKRAKKHTAKKANRMPKEGSQLVYSRPAGRSSSAPAWSR